MFKKTSPICQCHLHSWKKCWKVHIRVLALLIPPWIVNSKKFKKIKKIWWRRTTNVLSACQVSLGNDIRGSRGKKKSILECWLFFLPRHPQMLFRDETWQTLKTFVILCHQFFEFFWTFLDFTIHGGSIRAKPRMGTFQHFFHECK